MIDTQTTPLPVETVTPIRPSEAIRLGCLTTGPARGHWFADDGSACVLGAMQIGFGGGTELGGVWPDAYMAFRHGPDLTLPAGSGRTFTPGAVLMILNDQERWSRERIASWLESIGL